MEERKQLSPAYLELLAEDEYDALKGCLVRVTAINGYVGESTSDTFRPDMTGKPVIVRIDEASVRDDIHRWMDEWLDPAYPVTIVERGDLPEDLRSCWIYGNCRSLYGGIESGDIWSVDRSPLARRRAKKLDIQEIAKRLGAEVCDPPPKYRHLMAFMANRNKEALYENAMEISDRLTGRKPSEAVEVYDQLADRKEAARRSIVDAENRKALEEMTAGEVEERLERNLKMPIDAGRRALERTDKLLAGFERLEALERRVEALEEMVLHGRSTK